MKMRMDFFHYGLYRAHKICDLLARSLLEAAGLQDHEIWFCRTFAFKKAYVSRKACHNCPNMPHESCGNLQTEREAASSRTPELKCIKHSQAAHLGTIS